jgi:hypothetical protein
VTVGGRGTRTLVADQATRPFRKRRPVPTGNTLQNARLRLENSKNLTDRIQWLLRDYLEPRVVLGISAEGKFPDADLEIDTVGALRLLVRGRTLRSG